MATSELAYEDGCPFCEIARGRDSSVETICEGPAWVAFFPPEPATPGHTLIIPRSHHPDLWALDLDLGSELMAATIRLGRAIEEALSPDGMNLISSSGREAEQTVFHVHLHVVPRWHDDGFGRIWPPKRTTSQRVKEGLAERIRRACSNRA
jgi:histidine triad (HIT) family protein